MSKKIEYNKIAIEDVVTVLTALAAKTPEKLEITTANAGLVKDKVDLCIQYYNDIDNLLHQLICETLTMVNNIKGQIEPL